ncbi:unnamed protein product [Lepeophtheirus salmonis]|uniref:(salmon louse) hypothetical protein n=1 Tax=Lepeophtheirus salmonis TaxID=72036 RepID=A0A7R8HE79_LEPSM|nr:unnamed protein product [Lepeophtheirus salmonis]CAF3043531.1 unnamed protein product [Lepeophtheirus salmonis]
MNLKVFKDMRDKIRRNDEQYISMFAKGHSRKNNKVGAFVKGPDGFSLQKSSTTKCHKLRKRDKAGTLPNLVFTDDKNFTAETAFNVRNDYVRSNMMGTVTHAG